MKFFYCFAALIFLSSCNRLAYERRLEGKGKIKCGWYGKMTTKERRNTFPFNQAHKIVLISYPNYATNWAILKDSLTTPWGEKLPFNKTVKDYYKITQPIIDTFKVFHRQYLIYEKVELNQNQVDSLSNLFFNYKSNRKIIYNKVAVSCCYKPRNSILFYDKFGNAIYNFEICFECSFSTLLKDLKEKREDYNSDRCMNYELYKEFFKQCHIKYGIENNE